MPNQYPVPEDYQLVVLDAETYYDKEFSLRRMANSTYIRDARFHEHLWGVRWPDGTRQWVTGAVFAALAKQIDWSKTAIIGHNLRFDGVILSERHNIKPALWIDTLGMSRAVHKSSVRSHGLDALAKHIGRKGKVRGAALSNMSGVRNPTPEQLEDLGRYCVDDVDDTWALYQHLRPQFPDREFWFLDWATRMSTEPKLVFDETQLALAYEEELAHKKVLMDKIPYKKTQVSSNIQFAALLVRHGVKPPTKISPTTGRQTFDFSKNSIQFRALETHSDPMVQKLIAARLAVKSTIKESRAMRFKNLSQEGAWCVPLNYAGALNTSRFSGGDKQNPQNLSNGSRLRDAIEAPKGSRVVAIDSAGIELRVAATLAGQRDVLERAEAKMDEYSRFASIIFGHEVNKHDHPHERNLGKVAVLSLGYQSGAETYRGMLFAQQGVIEDIDVCKNIVRLYRSTYARYPILWRALQQRMEILAQGGVPPNLPTEPPISWDAVGYRSQYSGARVIYPELKKRMVDFGGETKSAFTYLDMRRAKANEAKGYATLYGGKFCENLSQFLAREVVNYQTHLIWKETGLRPQLQVHDEMVYVVPASVADAFYLAAKHLMTGPVPWWPDLITAASGGVGQSYGEIDK